MDSSPALSRPSARRIPAMVWDARETARRLLDDAAARAAALVDAARQEADAIRGAAAHAGHEEGLSRATELLARAAAARDARAAQAEAELIDLALDAAACVVAEAVARDRSAAVEVARRAVEAAGRRRELSLHAHPADLAALREAEPALLAAAERARRIAFVADEAVERGGAVVETEVGTVDARLATQLAGLRRALLEGR